MMRGEMMKKLGKQMLGGDDESSVVKDIPPSWITGSINAGTCKNNIRSHDKRILLGKILRSVIESVADQGSHFVTARCDPYELPALREQIAWMIWKAMSVYYCTRARTAYNGKCQVDRNPIPWPAKRGGFLIPTLAATAGKLLLSRR